jgi:hypothetical protein
MPSPSTELNKEKHKIIPPQRAHNWFILSGYFCCLWIVLENIYLVFVIIKKYDTKHKIYTNIVCFFHSNPSPYFFFSMHINEKKIFLWNYKIFHSFSDFYFVLYLLFAGKKSESTCKKKKISWQIFNIFRFSCFLAKESIKSFFSIFNLLQTNIANKMIQMKNVMTFVLEMNGFSFSIWENLSFSFFGVRCREWKSLEVFKFCLWKF